MIGTSFWEYVFIRTSIFGLRLVTPASICFTAGCVLYPRAAAFRFPGALPLFVYTALETGFYFLVYLPRSFRLQAAAKYAEPLPKPARQALFNRCAKLIPDPERYLRKWFHDAPLAEIKRENLKDFYRWALFNADAVDPACEDEVADYVSQVESLLGAETPPGRGSAVPMRLTIDNFHPQHRPLVWYSIVSVVDAITFCFLRCHGFDFYRSPLAGFFRLFPFRPIALCTRHHSAAKSITYWHREHTSKTKPPVVFIHGIGIGLWPYVNFLAELAKAGASGDDGDGDDGQVGIIALEIMPISFRITTDMPSKEDMCREIQRILDSHGWNEFMLISHSYGTVVSTHLLHDAVLAPRIGPVIFVDPVIFLLHQPDVAYNFTYRSPRGANEWQLHYMASKDLGVAHSLARHFFWSDNILWKDELAGRRATAVLGGRDLIVDTAAVGAYLAGTDEQSAAVGAWKEREWQGAGLDVVFFPELDHAQVFERRARMMQLIRLAQRYLGDGPAAAGSLIDDV